MKETQQPAAQDSGQKAALTSEPERWAPPPPNPF